MRGFSLVAVCSYSVNKYHRECIKTHYFDIRNTTIFWRGDTTSSSDSTPSAPSALELWRPFQMDWTPAFVKS